MSVRRTRRWRDTDFADDLPSTAIGASRRQEVTTVWQRRDDATGDGVSALDFPGQMATGSVKLLERSSVDR